MKHTRHNESATKVKLTVTLDAADLATAKNATVQRLAPKVKVPGFRQGKVPMAVAEKHLDTNLLFAEVANDAINHFLSNLLEAEQIQPLDQPKVELTSYVPGEALEFKTDVEMLPAIKLGDYKNLKVKKPAVTVTDDEVTTIIERMRQGMAEKHAVERAAKAGDEVVIDFTGTKNGEIVAGASGKDYPLVLGSNSFIPGFEDGLAGKKAGESFELPLTFPKDYHAAALAGEQVVFTGTIKKVNELKVPELNDDFASKCGPFKTVAELQADVKRELTEQKERENEDTFKQLLLEALADASDIPTPEILISDQLDSQEQDFVQNLRYRGMTLEQYLAEKKLSRDDWREQELRAAATRNVRIGLALAELRKLEDISISAEELNQRWATLLQMYGNDAKTREELSTPTVRRDFANRLVTEKTIEHLMQLNSSKH